MRYRNFPFLLALTFCSALTGCKTGVQAPQNTASVQPATPPRSSGASGPSNDGNLLLGNPTNAGKNPDNYLLERPQYTLSYNRSRGEANWVAWHVDAADLGETDRSDNFRPDPALPREWQIGPGDYRNSGYDRGHICPSGDRTSSREANDATFYMSNMLPQTAELNRAVWGDFEEALRDIVRQNNEIYVIAGGAGEAKRIAQGRVSVPKVCWKVAVILPAGKNDRKRINAQTRVIAVAMPNVAQKKLRQSNWRDYIVTTRKLSDAIGIEFFPALPPNVRAALLSKADAG